SRSDFIRTYQRRDRHKTISEPAKTSPDISSQKIHKRRKIFRRKFFRQQLMRKKFSAAKKPLAMTAEKNAPTLQKPREGSARTLLLQKTKTRRFPGTPLSAPIN